MLTQLEFNILMKLFSNQDVRHTQRTLAEGVSASLGKTNQVIRSLIDRHLVDLSEAEGYHISERGIQELEPYKVNNAVIMAAGTSSRFVPLSYEKPKGLLRVKGEVLIEREIQQLQEAGIHDITIVVGYMKEKFFYLEEKYGVKLVINEDYYRYNNTSTLIRVLDRLSNTYICSSDNYFTINVFEPYVYRAYYSAVYAEGGTDEYCIQADGHGLIKKVTVGGADSWYMLGHVYFDREFSRKFSEILKREYNNTMTREQLWENLYMRYVDELPMYIRKYDCNEILEFDSLEDLRNFDGKYLCNADSRIFDHICQVLHKKEEDILDLQPIKTGLTNSSFSFTCGGVKYVYRHPGAGTEKYINRASETKSMAVAKELGLDRTFIYMDEKEGWKLSYYIDNARTLDYHDEEQVKTALGILRKLHNCNVNTGYAFDVWQEIKKFEDRLAESSRNDFEDMEQLHNTITKIHELLEGDGVQKCLCHCDSYDPNFLVDGEGRISLIDWEYSGMSDPGCDIGTFIACSDYTMEEADRIIDIYLDHPAGDLERRHFIAYTAVEAYYWFIWAIYQDSLGKNVGEYLYIWYRYTKLYSKRALHLYGECTV